MEQETAGDSEVDRQLCSNPFFLSSFPHLRVSQSTVVEHDEAIRGRPVVLAFVARLSGVENGARSVMFYNPAGLAQRSRLCFFDHA